MGTRGYVRRATAGIVGALAVVALGAGSATAGWEVQQDGLATFLTGVSFVDGSTGFATGAADGIGSATFRTDDGGESWTPTYHGTNPFLTLDVSMADDLNGVVGSAGFFFLFKGAATTTDGGASYSPSLGCFACGFQDVHSLGANDHRLVGFWMSRGVETSGIAASRFGGRFWAKQPWPYDTSARYAHFLDGNRAYVTGGQWPASREPAWRVGAGLDAGARVTERLAVGSASAEAPAAPRGVAGYRAVIAYTDDGGATYTELVNESTSFYMNGITFVSDLEGWAVAEGEEGAFIIHTADGGASWTQQWASASARASLVQVRMLTPQVGFAVGAQPGEGFNDVRALIVGTGDGGDTWVELDTSDLPYALLDLSCPTSDRCWAVGANNFRAGVLRYTAD